MFDTVGDAAVVEAIAAASREQSAACGRELIAIGELYARRAPEDETDRIEWAIDGHANVVSELSAALNISRGRAAGRLGLAIDLRERFPKVAEVFAAGAIDFRMMVALVNRSRNVNGDDALARLDAAFAQQAPKWMKMSGPKLHERIDMWVEKYDPAGVREPKPPTDDRYVEVGPISPGMVGVWAKLAFTDGVAFDTRLDEIAATVCREDPRTASQRRADALIAMAAGQLRLECGCGAQDCPSGTSEKPLAQLVIEVIAEQSTIEGRSDNPGYLPGFGAVPAAMLRDMVTNARLRPVTVPEPCAEQGYRPSAALARFIRVRDLTCRFPGCDVPATACQIDHTIPYPLGPTHPSNLKLLCVFHHLLKTFWTGTNGWSDSQQPDGTVIWRAPSGQMYTTVPGGTEFFNQLGQPTGDIDVAPSSGPYDPQRGAMMPIRKRTRAEDKAYRIALERQHNAARIARKQLLLAERIARDDEPPPF
ncbi:HNH endonuclease [Mycolicibacterium sp. GF69]|uniref:HNH endonuclease signature motif containing protein n=1 Tax=Mycolicibacterium sp. GF69 TaxID=2267251 RepID=UPI000DCE0A1A|nr:HNH endonuclease signature motif containing protein [Mycolicibacterium sp. GF69]RAV15739.1 HNH endonuclease [Mycolicibacterium sp. GF69]